MTQPSISSLTDEIACLCDAYHCLENLNASTWDSYELSPMFTVLNQQFQQLVEALMAANEYLDREITEETAQEALRVPESPKGPSPDTIIQENRFHAFSRHG